MGLRYLGACAHFFGRVENQVTCVNHWVVISFGIRSVMILSFVFTTPDALKDEWLVTWGLFIPSNASVAALTNILFGVVD